MTWRNRITGSGEEDPRKLTPNPRNWRKHPKSQAVGLVGALEEVGWVQDIIVNTRTGHLVDGHLRVELAVQNKEKAVPVKYVDLSEQEEALVLATLDPLGAMAEADKDRLGELLASIDTGNESLQDLLSSIGKDFSIPSGEPQDTEPQVNRAAELMKEWGTEPEQLWRLGPHQILCGDATRKQDVGRLMQGGGPELMVTDPPYGVEYDPEWRARAGINENRGKMGAVQNDSTVDWSAAWLLFPGDVAYIWHAGRFSSAVQESLIRAGFTTIAQIIWKKDRFALSRGDYHWQHEPCWYVIRKGARHHWAGDRSQSTVWEIPRADDVGHGHGTQKPLECMLRPIRNHKAKVIYDPFLGSGTTLIACENLGRICRGMEIAPEYIAVTLQRFKDTFGKEPELDG